jgi:transposase InsO family protein
MSYFNSINPRETSITLTSFIKKRENFPYFLCMNAMHTTVSYLFLALHPGMLHQDSTAAINFIKSIVFRFGVPHSIITDNGMNFTSKEFKYYCESMGIKLKFASVAHPKTNGQVEKANGLICNRIKKRLLAPPEKAKHAWVDE